MNVYMRGAKIRAFARVHILMRIYKQEIAFYFWQRRARIWKMQSPYHRAKKLYIYSTYVYLRVIYFYTIRLIMKFGAMNIYPGKMVRSHVQFNVRQTRTHCAQSF